jgi:hypothetical protein
LPNGEVRFTGAVVERRRNERATDHAVSIKFHWTDSTSADRLNANLFGNNLQWALNDWRETRSRDISLRELFSRSGRDADSTSTQGKWRFCSLRSALGDETVECTYQKAKGDRDIWRIVSYAPPPAVHQLTLTDAGGKQSEENLTVLGSQTFFVGDGAVYLIVMARDTASHDLFHHASPVWRQPENIAA